MSKPSPYYVDGYVTPERQVTVIPDVEFPFENYSTPDTYARILSRRYDVTPQYFSPKISTRTSWTNYLLYSETFANAAWTKTNITNTDNSLANPNDGAVTMAGGLETATNAEHAYQQAYTFTATAHTLSFIIQPNGRTWYRLKANDGTTNFTAFFNLTGAGLVGTVANCTAAVALVAAGVYRITITFTSAAAAGNVYLNYSTDGSTVSYAGNTALGGYVWGAQIVRASTAGPVIITTSTTRSVSSPNLDPDDIFAYLVYERSPVNYTSSVAGIERKFSRIPTTETAFPGSRYIQLPALANDYGTGSTIPVQSYPTLVDVGTGVYNTGAAAIFTDYHQSLFGAVKIPTAKVIGYATGGTFTLTYGANTTAALNWNDSGATIAAAINGLASVISAGLTASVSNVLSTVTGGDLIITWTVGSTSVPVTMNGSLTITTSNHPTTQIDSVTQQDILLPDHLTVTSHSFNTGVSLATLIDRAGTPGIVVVATANWGSIDANTLWVPTAGSGNNYIAVGPFARSYVPGQTYLLRVKQPELFYLPGVSTGITTPADIPVPADLQNPADFVSAILTLTGFQTYQSEGPASWMGTLIYRMAKIQINLDDL